MIEFTRRESEPALPDMTPLLDVVFILLIFFVIGAAFAVHGMDLDLPESRASRSFAGKTMEIVLDHDGGLYCDGDPVTVHELAVMLEHAVEPVPGRTPPQILLKAASDASVGAFMRAVDVIRSHGGRRLVIATQGPRQDDAP